MEDQTILQTTQPIFGNLAAVEVKHTVDYGRMTMIILIALASWFGFSLILKLITAAIYKRS